MPTHFVESNFILNHGAMNKAVSDMLSEEEDNVFVWLDCLSTVILKKRPLLVQYMDLTPVIMDQLVADDVLAETEKSAIEALPEKIKRNGCFLDQICRKHAHQISTIAEVMKKYGQTALFDVWQKIHKTAIDNFKLATA